MHTLSAHISVQRVGVGVEHHRVRVPRIWLRQSSAGHLCPHLQKWLGNLVATCGFCGSSSPIYSITSDLDTLLIAVRNFHDHPKQKS